MSEFGTPSEAVSAFTEPELSLTEFQFPLIDEEKLKQYSFADLQNIATGVLAEMLQRNPGQAETIRRIAPTILGVFALDRKILQDRDSTHEERIASAKLQQNLTDNILYAMRRDAPPVFVQTMFSLVRTTELIASRASSYQGEAPRLSRFWNGVKGELALARLFVTKRFSIRLPNYRSSRQVTDWDLNNGVDFVATPPLASADPTGFALCVDAKSNGNGRCGLVDIEHKDSMEIRDLSRFPDTLQNVLYQYDRLFRAEIQVNPYTDFVPFDPSVRSPNELYKFCALKTNVSDTIMRDVKSLTA